MKRNSDSMTFWKQIKPYFSNKENMSNKSS